MRQIFFFLLFVDQLSWGMLILAAPPATFVTVHVDAFKLNQLQGTLDLKSVSFKIEPLCGVLIGPWAPGVGARG